LLLTSSLDTVAYNWEAAQILAFPDDPERLKRLSAFLASQIRSKLSTGSSKNSKNKKGQQFVSVFKSGIRTYQCRAVNLHPGKMGSGTGATTIALLLERQPPAALLLKRRIWEEFELTHRERQTVELVLQGMTTKEIAGSLNVSPNTVKTYLRLIMTKMRVATRSGIVGKILAT
jgi:DNA-binding CsgD family transcriptional regulator